MDSPEIWLIRHGPTQWSTAGKHTGRTDVPLTGEGEEAARALRPRLDGTSFDVVLSSPLSRARRTAELAGLEPRTEDVLVEWDYGDAEGRTRSEVRDSAPELADWSPWTSPMPAGEQLDDVGRRADHALGVVRDRLAEAGAPGGRAVVVAHGHFLRVLAARWLEEEPRLGQRLAMEPATVSVLGYDRETPVLLRWNV